jgi:glycine oxidase
VSRHADVLILGGGVIGCLSALRLAQRGLDVTLVERAQPGAEASGAAAGMLAPQVEAKARGPFLELALHSRSLWPALVEELRATGIDVGYRADGTLALALDEDELAHLDARAAWQRAAGLPVEKLSAPEVRALEPELAQALGALRFAGDHQVEPARLMRALEVAAARAGVHFVTAEARRVLHDGARVTGVATDGERYQAAHVIVACGPWSSLLDGAGLPPRAVTPLRGQLVELELRPPPLGHVVFAAGGYLVPRADGRVVVGSTEEEAGFRKQVTAHGLEQLCARARRVCPALAGRPVERAWSGLRPRTADGLPYLGATAIAGLSVATGHVRNGILLAPVTAEIMCALVTGSAPPVDVAPFSPLRA